MRDRHEIGERIVRQLLVERRIDAEACRGEQQCVPIRRRVHRELRCDDAARARPVVDDELLPETPAELARDDTRDEVGVAAGCLRDDEAHGTFGIIGLTLCMRARSSERNRACSSKNLMFMDHESLLD